MGLRFFNNSSGIGCGSAGTLAIQDSCTWLAWVYAESIQPSNRIFEYSNISSPTVAATLFYYSSTQGGVGLPRLTFERGHQTTTMFKISSFGIPLNTWVPVAVTYNGNSSATGTRIFFGGTETLVYQAQVNGVGAKRNSSGNFYIGNRAEGGRVFGGSIAQLTIINEILSDNLILKWAQSRMALSPYEFIRSSSNLIAYYLYQNDFPEGASALGSMTTIDRSNNNNHGSPFTNVPVGIAQGVSYP